MELHFTFTPWREVDFALLEDKLTIRELSFSFQPALGLVLPTASPPALGIMASKTHWQLHSSFHADFHRTASML